MTPERTDHIEEPVAGIEAASESTAVDAQVDKSYARIAAACQLDDHEKGVFFEAVTETGDVQGSLGQAYQAMRDERRAAVALTLLRQGIGENMELVMKVGREFEQFLSEQPQGGIELDLAQVMSDPEGTVRAGIAGAVERVRSLDTRKMVELAGKFPTLVRLCEKLGIDGQGLLTHIVASPDQVIPEIEILFREAINGSSQFTPDSAIRGIRPRTVELITPWKIMGNSAQSVTKMAA